MRERAQTHPSHAPMVVTLLTVTTIGIMVVDMMGNALGAEAPAPSPLLLALADAATWAITAIFVLAVAAVVVAVVVSKLESRRVGPARATGYGYAFVEEDAEVDPCAHCQRSGIEGTRREYSKHLVVLGVSVRRLGGGVVQVCSTCEEDPIEGELEAERERAREAAA